MELKEMLNNLARLSAQMPTGARDPRALLKLAREFEELMECLEQEDYVGLLLEAGDCMYYVAKAVDNGLLDMDAARAAVLEIERLSGFFLPAVYNAAMAKYTLRARPGNPKDDARERVAAIEILEGIVPEVEEADSGESESAEIPL